ncbi:MAG: N-acetylneuraminate synthase, partial [Nitrospinae bacterium]|nr:N-acetylneuraminate synthase [Nitrospinota bacterium]
ARKSLVAAFPNLKGEVFSETNLIVKRPGTGLSPMRWNEVLGRKAQRDLEADEWIQL